MTPAPRLVRADAEGAAQAAKVLAGGSVVVVPTDTVYGLAARPGDPGAVESIYRIKGRPDAIPLPVLAGSVADVEALGVRFTPAARALAARWWPGPLTLAFGFEPGRSRPAWLAGRAEVAVRVPNHTFVLDLLGRTGVLVATSANRHGAPTPRAVGDVIEALGSEVDLVVDGGLLTEVPSTLVNVAVDEPVVEREGAIPHDAITRALPACS